MLLGGSDEAVPQPFRATNEDYRGSALSRGHMAPAGAHKQSQDGLNETFLLSSNILPQELSNNGSDWLRLERFERALTVLQRMALVLILELSEYAPASMQQQTTMGKVALLSDIATRDSTSVTLFGILDCHFEWISCSG